MRPKSFIIVTILAIVAAAAQAQEPARGVTYMPGEVIVKLKDGPVGGIHALSSDAAAVSRHEAALLRLQAKYGVDPGQPVFSRVRNVQSPVPSFYVLKTDRGIPALCAELNRDPEVEFAQPNYSYRPCREPNDPEYPNQYAHQLIQMAKAWDITTGSRDVVIAVIGTGVDVNHPDLKANIWVNKAEIAGNGIDDDKNGYIDDIHGWNFGDGNNDVTPKRNAPNDPLSENGHETNVAGVIAGTGNNGIGVCGVNWQCSLMVLRLSLAYTSKEIAAALDYAAANGARVANMSFGGDVFGPQGDQLVKRAIDRAYAKGVLLVASAGNSYSSRPTYPAAYYNVMAVASTNGEDTKTDHSSFGPWVDIAAPGTDIVTTDLGGTYIATAGTSFSSPYVAGVAALLLAYRPHLTHVQARAILENTTDPLHYGDLDPNVCYAGTGRVNAYQALLGVDRDYPLGEIVAPGARQTYASDGNAIALCLFVHGDSYKLDYRGYGAGDWTAIAQGVSPADPNGFVHLSLANPGAGAYELRLRVTRGPYTHTDRKLFDVESGSSHANWPIPEDVWDSYVYFMGDPLCVDVDGDGRNEIVQASIDLSSFSGGTINIWREDGTPLPHWPVQMDYAWPTSIAVGDIDGDGSYEVVVACEYDGEVYAYRVQTGRLVAGKWPAAVGGWYGYVVAGPVLADLDRDGKSEILVALDLESTDTEGLVALRADGTYLWQRRYTAAGPMSVADLNKDGKVEIALGGYGPGLDHVYTFILDSQGQQIARWPGASVQGTAIADLDGDGTFEMVFCTDQQVMAVHANGSTVWATKVADPLSTGGGLCIGDLDGDGRNEVYVTTLVQTNGYLVTRVYGFDYQGRLLTKAGYPKTMLGDPRLCTPLIADIDGDGRQELIVGAGGEPIMAWKADGSVAPGFPMLTLAPDIQVSPAIADLDQDGDLEIMLATDDYRFNVVDLPVPYAADKVQWGTARHDPQNSGWAVVAPKINLIKVPAQVKTGQRIEIPLSATNPSGLPLRWQTPTLPDGALYDANSATISWQPRIDQAFQTYTLAFVVTDGVHQDSRTASVRVLSNAIYYADMGTDPNWTLDSYWSWGVPAARGSTKNSDPNSGHTGTNALGCSLRSNYVNNMSETQYAVTPPIDCRGFKNIRLNFWRWLTVEWPKDSVCLQVSKDGVTWTDLWTPDKSPFLDTAWQFASYVVPAALGDNQPTVYFRWGLGPTNGSITYGGWKIDDVQVTGDKTSN